MHSCAWPTEVGRLSRDVNKNCSHAVGCAEQRADDANRHAPIAPRGEDKIMQYGPICIFPLLNPLSTWCIISYKDYIYSLDLLLYFFKVDCRDKSCHYFTLGT